MPESVDRIQTIDIRETIGFEGGDPRGEGEGKQDKDRPLSCVQFD